jgi:hypothetical protein
LQELAVQKGLSLAELVRRAIDNYVEQETGKKFKKQLERN